MPQLVQGEPIDRPALTTGSCQGIGAVVARTPRRAAPRTETDRCHAEEVDHWLAVEARTLSSDTVARLLDILRAAIRRAQAREYVRRNVALLCDPPKGQAGRPSKSLNLDQATRLLAAADADPGPMRAYVPVSLLTGARTEELRPLEWDRVNLDGDPATVELWRSVRASGDTKTRKSRRILELPTRCVDVLRAHRLAQLQARIAAGPFWQDTNLVFTTSVGTQLDAANVRRAYHRVIKAAGLDPIAWTPRELRHSFVSLLSASGVEIEVISHLVGHANNPRDRSRLPQGTSAGANPRGSCLGHPVSDASVGS